MAEVLSARLTSFVRESATKRVSQYLGLVLFGGQ